METIRERARELYPLHARAMRKQPTRVLRVVFESLPIRDRFSPKERGRFAVVVLYPEGVDRQLRTWEAARAHALDIARKMIFDRLHNLPDLGPLRVRVDALTLNLYPLGDVHRTLDDGTKVWLSEAERWLPPRDKS